MSGAGSIYGTMGATFQMAKDNFNPWQQVGAPTTYNWWDNASKAGSYGSYSDPGSYSQKQDWSQWHPGATRQAYTGQEADYSKLSDGDYGRLEQSLRAPGEIAAKNAYAQSSKQMNQQMGGRGLYGSSIAANQATQGANKTYQDTLATNAANAATSRYGMEQKDNQYDWNAKYQNWKARLDENNSLNEMNLKDNYYQNQFNQNRDQMQLNQNMDMNNYNYKRAALQNAYTDNAANYGLRANAYNNSLGEASYNDAWKRTQWDANERQQLYKNYTDYWSGVNPTEEEKTQNETASLANKRENSNEFNWGSIGSGLGSIAGSFAGGVGGAAGKKWFGV